MSRTVFFLPLVLAAGAAAQDAPAPKFEPQTIDDAIQIGYGLAVADINGDEKPDLVLADKVDIVWYENPTWKKHVMASRLTLLDNVCVAARDIDGDGKAEVAVGAQWNPSETTDETKSGAVFYLDRPADPTQRWTPVKLTHEPTVHRMKWVRVGEKEHQLVVVPLHGRGNDPATGAGEPVKVLAYTVPADRTKAEGWTTQVVDANLHKTHNFDVRKARTGAESLWLGGLEGGRVLSYVNGAWEGRTLPLEGLDKGVGEIRGAGSQIVAVIQPMHGNQVNVYHDDFGLTQLDDTLNQGHALLCQPIVSPGFPDVVAGWREKNAEGKVGIRLYVRDDTTGEEIWTPHVVDDNTMACEDVVAADLDADGRTDLIASGRATKNVIIYWNKTPVEALVKERPELPPLTDEEKAAMKKRKEQREAEAAEPKKE